MSRVLAQMWAVQPRRPCGLPISAQMWQGCAQSWRRCGPPVPPTQVLKPLGQFAALATAADYPPILGGEQVRASAGWWPGTGVV